MTREDVIKGLECCLGDIKSDLSNLCTNCPYANEGYATENCGRLLREDAIILLKECIMCSEKTIAVICDLQERLKAQEPRVMTLDDVRKWEQPDIWLEDIEGYVVPVSQKTIYFLAECVYEESKTPLISMENDYNKTWRCWTSRPSDKQMKAAKWE